MGVEQHRIAKSAGMIKENANRCLTLATLVGVLKQLFIDCQTAGLT